MCGFGTVIIYKFYDHCCIEISKYKKKTFLFAQQTTLKEELNL